MKLVKGSELIGKIYTTCFPEFEIQKLVHAIIPWEVVAADEGTGLVHIASGCGAEDFELGLKASRLKVIFVFKYTAMTNCSIILCTKI